MIKKRSSLNIINATQTLTRDRLEDVLDYYTNKHWFTWEIYISETSFAEYIKIFSLSNEVSISIGKYAMMTRPFMYKIIKKMCKSLSNKN